MSPRTLLLPALLLAVAAQAAPIATNEAALARGFTLPALGELSLPEPGQFAQQFDLDLINEFFLGDTPGEELEIDGEAARFAWTLRYGIAPGWELGLVLPLYFTGGGFLDSGIESWHDAFSLPNANREDRSHDQIRYRYERNGQTLLDVSDGDSGLGDVRLQAGRVLTDGVALRGQLKLPTGDAASLTGNEAFGGALWLDAALPFDVTSRFEGYAAAGLSYTAEGDVLPELQREFVPFGGLGLSCRLFWQLGATAQIAIHGPLYEDSDLAPLTRIGVPVSFGLNYQLSPETKLEVLVQEDTGIYASPDFVLHFAVALQ
jgi:hypothetical protein